jgi:RNA polymerase II subunit A-like phosphatase
MTHDNTALLVSAKEALQAEEDAKRRLLSVKKLSLIVDLDQTIIHTTCERTIAEWQNDKENPNYDAVKDVKSFQLADDKLANVAANWYYCKLRPGLKEFLDKVSSMYELHIYTMATRAYAQAIAKIIDPDRVYFGDRILSRDENGTDQIKTLHRLFPVNTDMVLVIDDRGDIWHWSDNLVKVRAYNFFLGAGDINASFLPKQTELITEVAQAKIAAPTKVVEKPIETSNGGVQAVSVAAKPIEIATPPTANGVLSDLEKQLLTMSGGDNPDLLEQQVKEQEKVIISQQTERPLLQKQLALEQAEETAEEEVADDAEVPAPEPHKHKSLLHDNDDELIYIERCLRRVHRAFFDEYQKKLPSHQGGRIAELRGAKSPKKRPVDDLGVVPDVKAIMPRMKRSVLQGVSIVFSGIIPLGMDVQ